MQDAENTSDLDTAAKTDSAFRALLEKAGLKGPPMPHVEIAIKVLNCSIDALKENEPYALRTIDALAEAMDYIESYSPGEGE